MQNLMNSVATLLSAIGVNPFVLCTWLQQTCQARCGGIVLSVRTAIEAGGCRSCTDRKTFIRHLCLIRLLQPGAQHNSTIMTV